MTLKEKKAQLAELNPEALFADGFEDALIGFACVFTKGPVTVYDRDKCIEILMKRDEMSHEEAEEFFSFNVEGAYVGEHTPAFLQHFTKE